MVIKVYYNGDVLSTLENLKTASSQSSGIIVGKSLNDCHIATKIVITPSETGKLDKKWLLVHAKELTTMLPSGLQIIGAFAMSSKNSSELIFKQLWKSYYESLEKQGSFKFTKNILFKNDAVFSALDLSLNGDVRSFKQFDAKNNFSVTSSTWKHQADTTKWNVLTSKFQMDLTLFRDFNDTSMDLIQDQLNDYCSRINNSIGEINGELVAGGDMLPAEKLENIVKNTGNPVKCKLYIGSAESKNVGKESEMLKSTGKIQIFGGMALKAYVPHNSTTEDALDALKFDAITSLYNRWNMTMDSYADSFQSMKKGVISLPKRVAYTEKDSKLQITYYDYVFDPEEENDALERIKENLNTEVNPDYFDNKIEIFYNPENDKEELSEDNNEVTENRSQFSKEVMTLVLGMVSLTCLIGYLISGFASRDKEKGEWDGSLLVFCTTVVAMLLSVFFYKNRAMNRQESKNGKEVDQ